jgi:hypothetical protein
MWYVVERQKNGKWKLWDDVATPERAEEICKFRRKVCPDKIWRWRAELVNVFPDLKDGA